VTSQDQPQHTPNCHKLRDHGGGSARPSSDVDLIYPHDPMRGPPGGGVGQEVWFLKNGPNY
jgi:hypothetical protein